MRVFKTLKLKTLKDQRKFIEAYEAGADTPATRELHKLYDDMLKKLNTEHGYNIKPIANYQPRIPAEPTEMNRRMIQLVKRWERGKLNEADR